MKRFLSPPAAHRLSITLIATLFCVAGVLHFVIAPSYVAIMPRWMPYPLLLVQLSGACELAGGVGYLVAATRRWAAAGLVALLLAVLPANLQMLLNAISGHSPAWAVLLLALRLPLQPLLMLWVWRCRGAPPPAAPGAFAEAATEPG